MNIQEQTDVVHQKVYDFLLYLYPLLSKYPKYEKFSLQTATKSHLYTADSALQQAKELIRLANDLKYSAMNKQHYGVSCGKLAEIGVMLGVLIEDVKAGSGSKGK